MNKPNETDDNAKLEVLKDILADILSLLPEGFDVTMFVMEPTGKVISAGTIDLHDIRTVCNRQIQIQEATAKAAQAKAVLN